MAAPDQLPKITAPLATREPSIHGSSPMARAVVESFFNLPKRERIRRKKYKTREEARQDVFNCIEFFCNPQRKHARNGMLSPIAFEQQQKLKLQGV